MWGNAIIQQLNISSDTADPLQGRRWSIFVRAVYFDDVSGEVRNATMSGYVGAC